MKVELTQEGKYVLHAETAQDNTLLFSLINADNLNGVRFNFPQAGGKWDITNLFNRKPKEVAKAVIATAVANRVEPVEDAPTNKRKYTKRTYLKHCPVVGCDHKGKTISLHLRMKHGVQPDGSVKDTFQWGGGSRANSKAIPNKPVTMPVVKLPDGTYKVRPQRGLLD